MWYNIENGGKILSPYSPTEMQKLENSSEEFAAFSLIIIEKEEYTHVCSNTSGMFWGDPPKFRMSSYRGSGKTTIW